jgi:hypothetical protein
MRKPIITLALVAAGLVAGTIPGVAAAQANSPESATPPPAAAAPSGNVRKTGATESGAPALTGISVFAIVPFAGVGLGVRYMLPVGLPAIIHHARIKDAWAVEFGADVLYLPYSATGFNDYHETHVLPLGGLMWNVWLTPQFAVYPKAEAGFSIRAASSTAGAPPHSGVYIAGAAGLLYQISSTVTLRAEFGTSGARIGAGFFF